MLSPAVSFEKETSSELGTLLKRLAAAPPAGEWERAVVRDAARDYRKRTALSKELAQREARLSSEGYQAWAKARAADDFGAFKPVLVDWLALVREKCAAIDPSSPSYDVALDGFERGLTSSRLDAVFSQVRDGIVPLLAEVKARGTAPDASWLSQVCETWCAKPGPSREINTPNSRSTWPSRRRCARQLPWRWALTWSAAGWT